MQGLELSEKFYKEHGEKIIEESFSHIKKYLAVGLSGSGSECMGFDDEISKDHDFEPGFCIFLPEESLVSRRDEFLLERAYAKLPKEFMGYKRSPLNPVGGNRHGVIRMENFFQDKTGDKSGVLRDNSWFYVSEQYLLEATGGKVFVDHFGRFSAIRQALAYLPEDVRLKKLAGNLLLMGQAGQYNYPRCVKRGETGAAQLAAGEFVSAALKVIFLLNKKYIPYYKWVFRALRDLPILSSLHPSLEFLITSGNGDGETPVKEETIEDIAAAVIGELERQTLTSVSSHSLEACAYSVNDKIGDPCIRNLHILYAI